MQTAPGLAPASPPAPPVRGRRVESEPPADTSWDEAATAKAIPDDDDDTTVIGARRDVPARALPNVEPTPQSMTQKVPDAANRAPQTATAAIAATPLAPPVTSTPTTPLVRTAAGLATTEREEVWSIVRAAVDQAIAPLGARIKDLEARLEKAERAAAAKPAATATQRLASIPVSVSGVPPKMEAIPASPAVPDLPPGSLPPTGFGVAVVPKGPRSSIDLEAIAKQPVGDMDFPGGSKRLVGRVVVALMLLAVVAAIVMTILSHQS